MDILQACLLRVGSLTHRFKIAEPGSRIGTGHEISGISQDRLQRRRHFAKIVICRCFAGLAVMCADQAARQRGKAYADGIAAIGKRAKVYGLAHFDAGLCGFCQQLSHALGVFMGFIGRAAPRRLKDRGHQRRANFFKNPEKIFGALIH